MKKNLKANHVIKDILFLQQNFITDFITKKRAFWVSCITIVVEFKEYLPQLMHTAAALSPPPMHRF